MNKKYPPNNKFPALIYKKLLSPINLFYKNRHSKPKRLDLSKVYKYEKIRNELLKNKTPLRNEDVILSEATIQKLGLSKVDANNYEKVHTPQNAVEYERIFISFIKGNYISISGYKEDYRKDLLRMFFIKDENDFIDTIKKVLELQPIFFR